MTEAGVPIPAVGLDISNFRDIHAAPLPIGRKSFGTPTSELEHKDPLGSRRCSNRVWTADPWISVIHAGDLEPLRNGVSKNLVVPVRPEPRHYIFTDTRMI